MAALSQLSYSPKVVVGGEVYRGFLIDHGRREAQVHVRTAGDFLDRHVEAAFEVVAVQPEAIDLLGRVCRADIAVRRVPARPEMRDDDGAFPRGPFALHPQELGSGVDHEVIPPTLDHGTPDDQTEFDGRQGDRRLGYRSFHRAL
jgi:hypothetical protein